MILSLIYKQKYLIYRVACYHYILSYVQYLNFNCFIENAHTQNIGGHDTVDDLMRPLVNTMAHSQVALCAENMML